MAGWRSGLNDDTFSMMGAQREDRALRTTAPQAESLRRNDFLPTQFVFRHYDLPPKKRNGTRGPSSDQFGPELRQHPK
jgi:hypothetical protein